MMSIAVLDIPYGAFFFAGIKFGNFEGKNMQKMFVDSYFDGC